MSADLGMVRGLAEAFVDSLDNLSPKEREQMPSAAMADNFNRVLVLAKEVEPHIDTRMWPKPVETFKALGGREVSKARYVELVTYSRQLLSLLPTP